MPMPTTSPEAIAEKSTGSSVSSTRQGSPHSVPVAAASTYNQRGVMTATPNDTELGLIRWTRELMRTSSGADQPLTLAYWGCCDVCAAICALKVARSSHVVNKNDCASDEARSGKLQQITPTIGPCHSNSGRAECRYAVWQLLSRIADTR